MIGEYQKAKTQVILSATLKDEEYTSGRKYYDIPGVNAIDYECHQDSHILQPQYIAEFSSIINSFGLSFA